MKINAHIFPQLKSWTDRARQYLEALREPINKMIQRKNEMIDAYVDKKIFTAYLKSDKEWSQSSQSYYAGVAMAGDTMLNIPQVAGPLTLATASFGGLFSVIGGGIAITGAVHRFFSMVNAGHLLEKRLFTKNLISNGVRDAKVPHKEILDSIEPNIGSFRSELRSAEKDLRILQTSRRIKMMRGFYQQVDEMLQGKYSDGEVLDYTREVVRRTRGFPVVIENMCRCANEGLRNLQSASAWLEKMPASPVRDALIHSFVTMADEFRQETHMLPKSMQLMPGGDPSIWSGIQDLCKHVESLKTSNARPHLVVENPDPSPTSPPTLPQLRQVRRRP